MDKVYIVSEDSEGHSYPVSVHKTEEGAHKAWDALRRDLIDRAKNSIAGSTNPKLVKEMVKNLSCEDPKKIDNYPHATPRLDEFEVEE